MNGSEALIQSDRSISIRKAYPHKMPIMPAFYEVAWNQLHWEILINGYITMKLPIFEVLKLN